MIGVNDMSKHIFALALFATLSLALAGCADFQSASGASLSEQAIASNGMKPIAHVNGEIWGYYLFNICPVITGDPKKHNVPLLLTDTVTLENTVDMVTSSAKDMGGKAVLDLDSKTKSTGMMTFWILWYREYEVSGNVVK